MEDEERQKKLEAGKAKVTTEPEAAGPAVGGGSWEGVGGGLGSGDRCSPGALPGRKVPQGLHFPFVFVSLQVIEKAWCYYLAHDTSVMIGRCGSFLVNAQIKPLFYCIVINWYLLFLNLQPFTFL